MTEKYQKVIGKTPTETERLTKIIDEKLKKERDANLTAEIHKISEQRKLLGDRRVFKDDEEFKEAGFEILKRFGASDN